MDLQTLAKNHKIKVLHLEVTSICNLSCPQCDREFPENFDKEKHLTELSLDDCKEMFDEDFIMGLEKVFMCGVVGDPCAAKDTLEIFEYFRQVNPEITLGINTNGSIKSIEWWTKLGKLFNQPLDYVVFSIDGLKDTNHIYRKVAKWDKIINNATAFIDAGGSAHWDMLVFKHNEHQVNEARDLAKKLGFAWFNTKVSKRFDAKPVDYLQPPSFFKGNNKKTNIIKCHAIEEGSVYVSANGVVSPCCWFGKYSYIPNNKVQWYLNDWKRISSSWVTDEPADTCSRVCTTTIVETVFKDQWTQKIELSNL